MFKKILMTLAIAFFAFTGQANANEIYTGTFSSTAVGGYDTVSYFQGDGVPVKGSDDFTTEYKGATWKFSSAENLALFEANPTQYAPQYGGYCAWAVGHDTLAKGDPEVYHIENGKLYLNINNKIKGKWLPRKAELIEKADVNYPELIN